MTVCRWGELVSLGNQGREVILFISSCSMLSGSDVSAVGAEAWTDMSAVGTEAWTGRTHSVLLVASILPTPQPETTSCSPLTSVVNISLEDGLLFLLPSVAVMDLLLLVLE